jgi:4a-hydroxytetrahydrobiopterin dehydratase
MTELAKLHCQARQGEADRLPKSETHQLLAQLPRWELSADGHAIVRNFKFPDFLTAVAFVNVLAAMAEAENHHPDLELGYGRCGVRFNTHDVGGLSLNDFICAAKTDGLYAASGADRE